MTNKKATNIISLQPKNSRFIFLKNVALKKYFFNILVNTGGSEFSQLRNFLRKVEN